MRTSYNGWSASENPHDIGVEPFVVDGVSFPGGVRKGDPTTVLAYVAGRFHREVEPLHPGWCWGWSYRKNRNANNLSNHSSGSAIDCNAPDHPNGARGTFTARQVAALRRILAAVDGVVRWGGDYTGTPDEMHLELTGSPEQVAAVARRLRRPTPPTTPDPEDDDMTPKQAQQLADLADQVAEVKAMLTALVAPRRPDKQDTDKQHVSLGDVLTAQEAEK